MAKGSPFPDGHKGVLDRTLSLFTDVRAGEGVGALLLATNVFYLLAFYQVLKIVRDALILSESGAVAASYASAGMAAVLFVFVPAYGALARAHIRSLEQSAYLRRLALASFRSPVDQTEVARLRSLVEQKAKEADNEVLTARKTIARAIVAHSPPTMPFSTRRKSPEPRTSP